VAAVLAAALSTPAQAQAPRKPAPKAAAKPAAKPAAAPAPRTAATPKPAATAPAPAPAPAPAASTAAAAGSDMFAEGTNTISLGLGLGTPYTYGGVFFGGGTSSTTPAFSVFYERGIKKLGPGVIGGGVFAGYYSHTYSYSYSSGTYKDRYSDLLVTVRATYHYPVTEAFDAYAGVGVGVHHVGYSSNYSGPYYENYGSTSAAEGIFVGGRYFFTNNLAAFGELGYDHTYLKVGLTAKF